MRDVCVQLFAGEAGCLQGEPKAKWETKAVAPSQIRNYLSPSLPQERTLLI